jgi:hypothetical protein
MANQIVEQHPERLLMFPKLEETRDSLAGEFFIKLKTTRYLKHPSSVDSKSPEAAVRYGIYIDNAEYDNYPHNTLKSLVGRMKFEAAKVEVPPRLSYLIESADGDGMSLSGMMTNTAKEALSVKWQVIIADYKGLSDVDTESLSIADIEQMQPRVSLKAYSRDNVVDWHYERVNGVMQLTYIMLLEKAYKFIPASQHREVIESYLILALDEQGNYYQQKMVRGIDAQLSPGEPSPVSVGGQPLKWLPVLIASDEELAAGSLPREMGYVSPICELALMRYRMSAEYKETIRNLPPTTYTKGWKGNDMDTFAESNGGRRYIQTGSGSVNNLPEGVTVEVVGVNAEVQAYERYLYDTSLKRMAELGAVMPGDMKNVTAEAVSTTAAEQNARLENLADALESVYRRLFLYAGMFEGLWSPDNIEQNMDAISIELPRDFANAKLSPQERDSIRNDFLSGLISQMEAREQLIAGGVPLEDAEAYLNRQDSGEV